MMKAFVLIATNCLLMASLAGIAAAGTKYEGKLDVNIIAVAPSEGAMHLLGTIKGEANVLGQFNGWVSYKLELATNTFEGQAVKVAANGDHLYEVMSGEFLDPVNSVGSFTITGGTGRLQGASGSGAFTGVFPTPAAGSVAFQGALVYQAANRRDAARGNSSAYNAVGKVVFANLQKSLSAGELAPYVGVAVGSPLGMNVQTGTIQPLPATFRPGPDGAMLFDGVVGPHPQLGTAVHVISTSQGDVYCTWVATFSIKPDGAGGMVLSGDGQFTVTGGTGRYQNATGAFRTLFVSQSVGADADGAIADVQQQGIVQR
jgi:hypothetical protein